MKNSKQYDRQYYAEHKKDIAKRKLDAYYQKRYGIAQTQIESFKLLKKQKITRG